MHVNLPSTRFSAYLKFGCVSIREVYNALFINFGKNNIGDYTQEQISDSLYEVKFANDFTTLHIYSKG